MPKPSLALLTLALGLGAGLEKHWLADVEWQTSSNWLNNLPPGPDSLVAFPLEARHAVGMPRTAGTIGLAGLRLSRDGLLALPENGRITVSDHGTGESHWLRESPYYWVDPLNWNASSEAVPHLERVPCQSDVVVLPGSSRTFSARLPYSRGVEVRGVRLEDSDEAMSRWTWRDARDRSEFVGGPFSVEYSPAECKDCPCQEGDVSAYWEEVCSVQRPRCGLLACDRPLKVEGHCCFYCGGRVRVSGKTLPSTMERVVGEALRKYGDGLFWHSRPTWDGAREILITERGAYEGTSTVIAVADLEAALREERVEVLYSETSGGALRDNRILSALGPLFGGLFALLPLTLLLCLLSGYTISQVWEAFRETIGAVSGRDQGVGSRKKWSFGFARFENVSEGGSVQLADTAKPSSDLEGTENPLYDAGGRGQRRGLVAEEPVSLAALERDIELDRMEDVDMDIENM